MSTNNHQLQSGSSTSTGAKIFTSILVVLTMLSAALIGAAAPAKALDRRAEEPAAFSLIQTDDDARGDLSVNIDLAGPLAGGVGGLYGSDIAQALEVDDLWALGHDGTGIDVAVIDTGVAAAAGLDAPGKVINGPDFSFNSQDAELRHKDFFGHGTAMAGLVAGEPRADIDPLTAQDFSTGTAPGARIVNVKVGDRAGIVDVSQVIAAIDWVVQNKNANGMNMQVLLLAYDTGSLEPYEVDPLSFAVENAWNHGIVVVVAAGNQGRYSDGLGNPATNPHVLAIGASVRAANSWVIPGWASSGDGVRNPDVVVPAGLVLAPTTPDAFLALKYPEAVFNTADGLMIRGSGTSQAAASAAGVVAILRQVRPDLNPDEIKAALTETGEPVGNPTRRLSPNPRFQGNGHIDAFDAMYAPVSGAMQFFAPATGTGSLDASRGIHRVASDAGVLEGEVTAYGDAWNSAAWTAATSAGAAYGNQVWEGTDWIAGDWLPGVFTGSSWDGSLWEVAIDQGDGADDWASMTWSMTWSGATWSMTWSMTWSGTTWSGTTWSNVTWSGTTWSGSNWS